MNTRPPAAARPSRSVSVEALESRQLLAASATVTIGTTRQQTMDGFGTSLGGVSSASLIRTSEFQKAYYQDLGASLFRVALNPWLLKGKTASGGRSVGSAVYLGPDLQANINQFDFTNYNIVKYGQVARAAAKYGSGVKVIGSFWSPPVWMKGVEVSPITGQPNYVKPTFDDKTGNTSGGSLIDTDANLTQFGRYAAAYVKGFEEAFGVKLYAISIQNELAFHEYYSSAVYSPKLYVDAVKAVSRWFKKYGIDTKIIGPEDVGVGSTADPGILERQMNYIKAVRADPEANAAVSDYAIHGYADDGVTTFRSPQMWNEYYNGHKGSNPYNTWTGIKADHKPSLMTEASGYGETWNDALRLAGAMQDAIVQANTSGYVYWGISSPTASGEDLMAGANYKANKYVAFKHFAKFVRPGSVRLTTTGLDPTGVYTSAYVSDADKTLTSVMINESAQTQTVTLRLPGIALSKFTTGFESTAKFTWRQLKTLAVKHGTVTIVMPPQSLFTLQGRLGTTTTPPTPPPTPPPTVATGAIAGVYFLDKNRDGRKDATDTGLGGDKVFLDLNDDGVRDGHEPYAVTDAAGAFGFTGLAAGVYRVRRELPTGYTLVTAAANVTVTAGKTSGGVVIGIAAKTPTGGGTGGATGGGTTGGTGSGNTASVAGVAFGDTNGNGREDAGEPVAGGKTVFLDTNNNGRADAGESTAVTDARGAFVFTGLAAGTYRVRRALPNGFTYSPVPGTVTLTKGETVTGVLLGSKSKSG